MIQFAYDALPGRVVFGVGSRQNVGAEVEHLIAPERSFYRPQGMRSKPRH